MSTGLMKLSITLLVVLMFSAPLSAGKGADLLLENLDGDKQSLSNFLGKGQWVLFNVWGPKCPPCLEEVAELVSFHEEHADNDAVVVSLALDFPSFGYAKKDEVARFADEYFINFPVLLGDAYQAEEVTGRRLLGTPSSYLYDPKGKLVAVQVGAVTQKMIEKFIDGLK